METETVTEETTQQTRGGRHRAEAAGGAAINLGPKDQLVGRLAYDGDLRVQGLVEGEVTLSGDMSVENEATAKAKLEVKNLAVRGTFEGEAVIRERLLVAGSGSVNGTVRVARLVIEEGAILNGNISMEKPSSPSPNGRATEG
ncbi:MAG: polymer-forming cytoskeletal protein [Candidatus Dormibacteraeota bacterium]|nr:polymer-forming cytoskeletal protein [Candidatus Dormibacteraeota bacterium]